MTSQLYLWVWVLCNTYEGTDEGTGDVILHMEDGSYKTLSTEEVYNHMNKDYANKNIIDLLEVKY